VIRMKADVETMKEKRLLSEERSHQHSEIPWNLVTKNLIDHEMLRKKLREKITKLERYLKHFPSDAVHLHVSLERNPKQIYTAALTLRLPSNILYSKKSARDVIKAFDSAVRVLLRELGSLKSDLRREAIWKRKERRQELRKEIKGGRFAILPQPEGVGPQERHEVVKDLIRRHYRTLLRYARRQVGLAELSDEAPAGAIDPRGVTDEVVCRVLTGWRQKPERPHWLAWFYQLIHEEMRRRCQEFTRDVVSLENVQPIAEGAEAVEGYDAEKPLDLIAHHLEPFIAELRETVPDAASLPPDEAVAQKDLLEYFHARIQTWPQFEREAFDLYFVEGFEPDEVAMITGQSPGKVRQLIDILQQRLRQFLIEDAK
jgi:ribosomal subunit interface protein